MAFAKKPFLLRHQPAPRANNWELKIRTTSTTQPRPQSQQRKLFLAYKNTSLLPWLKTSRLKRRNSAEYFRFPNGQQRDLCWRFYVLLFTKSLSIFPRNWSELNGGFLAIYLVPIAAGLFAYFSHWSEIVKSGEPNAYLKPITMSSTWQGWCKSQANCRFHGQLLRAPQLCWGHAVTTEHYIAAFEKKKNFLFFSSLDNVQLLWELNKRPYKDFYSSQLRKQEES